MPFRPDAAPKAAPQPTQETQPLTALEGGLSKSMSTQPEDVLRRASALLDGQAVTVDVAAFTQRILNSVEGQSAQQIAGLADQYARSTHPTEGAPAPSPEMLQELAMTAAILEGRATELTTLEAPTAQMEVATVEEPTAANMNPETGAPMPGAAPTLEAANVNPSTTLTEVADAGAAAVETSATEDAEAPTTAVEQMDGEELSKMQERRTEILRDTFGLTEAGTLADARTVGEALKKTDKADEVETAMAELMSIDARLGLDTAVKTDAATFEADTVTQEPATVVDNTPAKESTEQVAEEAPTQVVTPAEPTAEGAPTEVIAETTTEEDSTDDNEDEGFLDGDAYEATFALDRMQEAIESNIEGFKRTLELYKKRERELDKLVGRFERRIPKFMLNKDRLKLVENLNAIQVAVAHVNESIAGFESDLVELQNANEVMDVFIDDMMEEVEEAAITHDTEKTGVMKMLDDADAVQAADNLSEDDKAMRAKQMQRRAGKRVGRHN